MPLWLHRLILSILFSLVTWVFVDKVIIDITILQYFFVEVTCLISLKLYTFILQLQQLDDDPGNSIE